MRRSALNILRTVLPVGLLAATSLAQSSSSCGVTAIGLPIYGSYAKTSAPFSATIQTTHDQKLADGNSIHGMIVTHAYRDSAGRILGETTMLCNMGPDGQFHPTINVTITDPANHTSMSWQINGRDKVVRIIHRQETQPSAPPPLTPEQRALNQLTQQHWRKNNRSEKLPDRNIAGVACEDTRQTTTIPAGEDGNVLPMEMKDEVCIASGTGLAMLRITDEPLGGHTQTEITEFSSGEPDPAVFNPPADYRIEEQQLRPAASQ